MPTCTMKMLQEVYWNNLNDVYLSLATGSENKKFRNTYEEKIYTNEDKLYEHDTQIDNFERSYRIVCEQCDQFEGLSEADQNVYKFPVQKLSPYRFYWDLKFKRHCQDQYFKVGKILKSKEMAALKKAFNDKLEFLRNQKNLNITDIKDSLKKNFTKSLDHKSFQFKDFMKKFQQK
jgi:histone deacetylase complex regulatory component SIN3